MDAMKEEEKCSGCGLVVDILVTRFECREEGCHAGVICTQCFSYGVEFGDHKSDHSYAVLTADQPLLDWDWTGAEEIKLLEAIEACGLGNWVDVAKRMGNKTDLQCETHYMKHYIYGSASVDLEDLKGDDKKDTIPPEYYIGPSPVLYLPSKVPLRPELGSVEHSELYAGYCPPRGDFFDEPDAAADKILNNHKLSCVYFPFFPELQMAMVQIYRSRLIQRERIKEVIAEHGLLDASQNAHWISRYADDFGERNVRGLLPLVQIMSADAFLSAMESMKAVEELKHKISALQKARTNGLKRLEEIPQFKRLDIQRRNLHVKPSQCRDVFFNRKNDAALEKFLQKRFREEASKITYDGDHKGARKKKPAPPPLAIENFPNFEKLSPQEKEFCSTLRLAPSSFLSMRNQLLAECRKSEGLRLSRAREVCNIDVNKTKRLYDFLLENNQIHR
ncbi:transcriptional adapter 2-alpha [Galendromus occidentalis]|uniref:Transcriptional adapter 2-alpha n=1 Tax=Galendromus occidentalis TaxID=34638 RepID=A0AAJ6QN48_9ACAR|nr:transcriptional adapter 2-alpha [Galendromus occidentalis]